MRAVSWWVERRPAQRSTRGRARGDPGIDDARTFFAAATQTDSIRAPGSRAKLFDDDVAIGDTSRLTCHALTRTDWSCTRARAATFFNPDHHDEVPPRRQASCRRCSCTACSRGLLATPPSTSNYVGIGTLRSYKVRFTDRLARRKSTDDERHRAREARPERDRARTCAVVNGPGRGQIRGEAGRMRGERRDGPSIPARSEEGPRARRVAAEAAKP